MEFKVGDKVRFAGTNGVVTEIYGNDYLDVEFTNSEGYNCTLSLYMDGSLSRVLNEKLVLIERPKKKVMKRFWLWDLKDNNGIIFKGTAYRDENGLGTNNKLVGNTLIKKHLDEFIDIEVEED